MEFLAPQLIELASKYPGITTFFLVVGVMRSVNKPLFAFFHAYVNATPSKKDDESLRKIESSKAYKAFCFILDYLTSMKMEK